MHLKAGDQLSLEIQGGGILLRPQATGRMVLVDGWWVFTGGLPVSREEAEADLADAREERARQVEGEEV